MLDSEEYLHLAINATESNDHHAALTYLHQALGITPENADALLLLGAVYAELGLMDRAIATLEECLSLNEEMEMAAIQLALLYIATGREDEARPNINRVLGKSSDAQLQALAEALEHMLNQNNPAAVESLDEALAIKSSNSPLRQTIKTIREQLTQHSEPQTAASIPRRETQDRKLTMPASLLGAYEKQSFEDDEE